MNREESISPPPTLSPQNLATPEQEQEPRRSRVEETDTSQNNNNNNNNNNNHNNEIVPRPPILDMYLPTEEMNIEWDNFGQDWPQQQGFGHDINHFYEINGRDQTGSRTRRSHIENLQLTLHNLQDHNGPLELLLILIFRRLINDAIEGGRASGYNGQPKWISVQINNNNFRDPFYVPFRKPEQNSAESIVASLIWLQGQYGDELRIFEDPLQIKIQAIWSLNINQGFFLLALKKKLKTDGNGACAVETPIPGFHGRKPRSLFVIENNDTYCLARAICVGIKWHSTGFL